MSMPDIVAAAFSMYMKAPAAWLALTVISFAVAVPVQWLFATRLNLGTEPTNEQVAGTLPLLAGILGATVLVDLFTHIAVIAVAADVLRGGTRSVRFGYLTAVRLFFPVLAPTIVTGLLLGLLGATVILIPLAIYLFVGWSLLAQVIVAEGESPFRALGRSRQLVRGCFWYTLWVIVAIALLGGILPGLIAGIFTRPFGNEWVNAVGAALAGALAIPFRSIAQTLLYADLRTRKGERPFVAPVKEVS
jgi:hypothetical protein